MDGAEIMMYVAKMPYSTRKLAVKYLDSFVLFMDRTLISNNFYTALIKRQHFKCVMLGLSKMYNVAFL